MRRQAATAALALSALLVVGPGASLEAGAGAAPRPAVLAVLAGEYAAARGAARLDDGTPAAVQARYDAARDLQEALRGRVTRDCVALRDALRGYAAAQVAAAEAVD